MVLALAIWGATSPERSKTFDGRSYCQETKPGYPNADVASPTWNCRISASDNAESRGEPADNGQTPRQGLFSVIHWTRDWLHRLVSDPVSLFTLVLGAFTIGLYRETAGLRLAADQQKLDTAAALEVAREASHVERAWLFFDSIIKVRVVDGIIDNGPTQNGFFIGIQWRNGGRSPAIKVALSCDAKIVEPADPIPVFFKQTVYPAAYAIIGQETTTQTPRIFVNDENYLLIRTRRKQLYFHSRVEYFDVFKKDVLRVSEFTGKVEFFDITHHVTHEKDVSVRMSSVGEQNTAT